MHEDKNSEKVISIAEARKRQKTVHRSGGSNRSSGNFHEENRKARKVNVRKIWTYIHFLLFLLVMAYFMQLCRGG